MSVRKSTFKCKGVPSSCGEVHDAYLVCPIDGSDEVEVIKVVHLGRGAVGYNYRCKRCQQKSYITTRLA